MRLPGQYYDGETGLHYNGARYYDPETDRYLTVDPIGLAGGINPYIYANANPLRFSDPLGLKSFSLEGYWGIGGGFNIGTNPDGTSFVNIRLGYGIGAGIEYDPDGTSPDWDPCNQKRSTNYAGVFGSAGVGYLLGEINPEVQGGYTTRGGGGFYGNVDLLNPVFSNGAVSVRVSAAAGIEYGVVSW